jgi:DNA-binding GntR family transcriptional regulator
VIGEALAQDLAQKIIFFDLPPKIHLTEEDVSARYDVSRSPVREAFRSLEAEGLVQRLARRGVRVGDIGHKDAADVYSCRIAIESLAAGEAAQYATTAHIGAMRGLLSQMNIAKDFGQIRRFFNTNVAITRIFHQAARNNTLERIASSVEKQALRYRYFAYTRNHTMLEATFIGHNEVVEAVARGEPDTAKNAATEAMLRSRHIILEAIDDYLADENASLADDKILTLNVLPDEPNYE